MVVAVVVVVAVAVACLSMTLLDMICVVLGVWEAFRKKKRWAEGEGVHSKKLFK